MDQQAQSLSRREFVKAGGAVLGGLAAAPALARDDETAKPGRVPEVVLGRTGVRVGRLGIGCAYFQRKHVTPDDVRATLHRALELGVNYLDTAPTYGNPETGFAEEKMGPAMPEVRDKVFLVTKTEEPTYEGTWRLLRQSLKRMKTDRIDLVHLHNFGDQAMWGDLKLVFGPKGAVGALREAKTQGVVRFIGASGHLHPTHFHAALDTGEIDVVMNAVNFVVRHSYDFEHKVWSRARRDNVGLVAMKVLGGAGPGEQRYRLPEEHYEKAIRYALSIPGLAVAVIGLENVAELEKATATVAHARPLSEDESRDLARVGLELAGQPSWKTVYGLPMT
jgi:aryl-alcohol dehydrogenase-like predicted oxidoreductase